MTDVGSAEFTGTNGPGGASGATTAGNGVHGSTTPGSLLEEEIGQSIASPSLRTLAQLSQALAVPVPIFFRELTDQEDASFVRAGEGIELARPDSRHGYRYELLAAQLGSRRVLQPYLVTIARGADPYPLFQHTGSEFIFVLEGRLTYRYGTGTYDLAPGDSLLLHGTVQHGPETLDELPIRLLSITLTRSDEALEMP